MTVSPPFLHTATHTDTITSLCRVCGADSRSIFSARLLEKQVRYYECPRCGYVQTEEPDWLDHAYSEAINVSDTGVMSRNLSNRNIVLAVLFGLGSRDGKVIDFAGGYGLLVRLLRDSGVDAYWMDKYCDNLVSRGFEFADEMKQAFLCTAFEVFEHLVYPCSEIGEMFACALNLLFTTEIIPDPIPLPDAWWYYGLHHGQHIGFYRIKTLQYLAGKYGKVLYTNGKSCHMFVEPRAKSQMVIPFQLLVKLSRIMPLISSHFFASKTWGDHLLLSENKDIS